MKNKIPAYRWMRPKTLNEIYLELLREWGITPISGELAILGLWM